MVQVRAALEKSEAEEDAKARVAVGVKALMEAAESSASWRALLRSPRHFAESLFRQVAEKRELQPLDLFGPPADGGVLQRLFSRRGVTGGDSVVSDSVENSSKSSLSSKYCI